jgi:hypothetical protein
MNYVPITCPVCRNIGEAESVEIASPTFDGKKIRCDNCGLYEITSTALATVFSADRSPALTQIQRAVVSYSLNRRTEVPTTQSETPRIDANTANSLVEARQTLPIPPRQSRNILRLVAAHEQNTGEPLAALPKGLYSRIGAASPEAALRVAKDMYNDGVLEGIGTESKSGFDILDCRLSPHGWALWERLVFSEDVSNRGFIAMKFGDARLDRFVSEVVKPAVRDGLGMELLRVDDSPRAGIIDNIIRAEIQDSAFVLVDLSHGNPGAYWEAGYAEGLGKPVIYLCEKQIWDDEETRPHFDVNHCTTIMWAEGDDEAFKTTLIATIQNSLREIRTS